MTNPQLNLHYSAPDFSAPVPDVVGVLLKDPCNIISNEGVLIVRVTSTVAVKFGAHVSVQEAKNMIYVTQNTTVPVPTVFAYYTYGPIDRDIKDFGSLFDTYIFMSFVDGETLDITWESYSEQTKTSITLELKTYIDSIRCLGGSHIGSVDHGSVTDPILSNFHTKGLNNCISDHGLHLTDLISGPFASEEHFTNAILDAYETTFPKRHIRNFLAGMLSPNQHRIVFTHGDLRPQNIMVKDGKITALIDWEMSGWYPEYWEFAKSLYVWRWQNDWYDYLIRVLQPYYAEYAFHSLVAQTLW